MRYFYYGREPENRGGWDGAQDFCGGRADRRNQYEEMRGEELVVEEDTIYEIDQECEECRRNRQNSRREAEQP